MNRFSRLKFILVFCLVLPVASAQAEPSVLTYIRQDGGQIIKIETDVRHFTFTTPDGANSDLGGSITDCSSQDIRCLNLGGFVISVPSSESVPKTWSASGYQFAVVGKIKHDDAPAWLVQVSAKGDTYMFYTFSKHRGIETLSLEGQDGRTDLTETFFLNGKQGLLASVP